MPRLHPDGRAVQGVTSISVDGVVPTPLAAVTANAPRWLDVATNEVIYQNQTAGNILQSIDLDTDVLTTESTSGASELGAGGGTWLSFLAAGSNHGTRSNLSGWGPFPSAGPADVDSSGRFAVVQNYQLGRGVSAYAADGSLVATWDVPLAGGYVIRCSTGLVAFPTTGFAWQLYDLLTGTAVPLAQRQESINLMVPLESTLGTLVLERSERLTLRRAGDAQGFVLTTDDTYTPDLIELSPGVIRIAYSATAGEGPTALRMIDLTINTGGTVLWTTASGSLVSSAGPTVNVSAMPASGAEGSGLLDTFLGRTAWTKPDHTLTEYAWQFLAKLLANLGEPVDLASQVTGVLPPQQGGTGGNTGTSVINAGNVTIGFLPQNVKWQQYDTSSTGTQDDFVFSVSGTQADVIRAANATTLDITGFAAGIPGQRLVVIATDADVILEHEDAGSDAENRIETFSGLDVTITTDTAAYLIYDGTSERWRLLMVSSASSAVASAGYWGPMCAGDTLNWGQINSQVGEWSPLTNGDPVTPELIFNSDGDAISVYTQLQEGPYLPPLVDSQADAIAVWTPTP